jgi:hypothetical protein
MPFVLRFFFHSISLFATIAVRGSLHKHHAITPQSIFHEEAARLFLPQPIITLTIGNEFSSLP